MANWINVKVRFKDERQWFFIGGGGRVSRLRIHAAPVDTLEHAKAIAADVITDDVVASRVDVDGRTVASFGKPTPPRAAKPVYGPAGGFTYLVDVTTSGYPVFHVRDGEQWGIVTSDIYGDCYREAKRSGLNTSRLNIHGRICLIATHGLVFHQRWERAA